MTLQPMQAKPMQYFVPLCKIDEEKRLVYGIAAVEQPDRSGEIMDYATAKPAFMEWSNQFSEATGGMSKGNVRAMHNPKSVAGKLTEMTFDDDAKAVHVCAKIVDDVEWQKTLQGCYTGFSIGGGYGNRWADGALKRYTPKIGELSLVDSPCIPGARIIELQKADGSVLEILATGRAPLTYGQMVPPKTYGDLAKGLGGIARIAGRIEREAVDAPRLGTPVRPRIQREGRFSARLGSGIDETPRAAAPAPKKSGRGKVLAGAAIGGGAGYVAGYRKGDRDQEMNPDNRYVRRAKPFKSSAEPDEHRRDDHGRFAAKIDGAYDLRKRGAHPGFKAVQGSIERRDGVSHNEAGAILGAASRRASAKAKRANPRLRHVGK